jgi:hypothetical protein
MTPNPLVYFDSAPDSGYSEDNLPPDAPSGFVVSVSNAGAELGWEASESRDFDYYRIYRSRGPAYPLLVSHNLVHTTRTLSWLDPVGVAENHYVITAVDVNGNESDAVTFEDPIAIEDPIPVEFSLRQNAPNPFNPVTNIRYDVPAGGGHVNIAVFDVAGRLVRQVLDEHRAPGKWTVEWDGTSNRGVSVASGVYFCRLRAPGYEKIMRMTLIK